MRQAATAASAAGGLDHVVVLVRDLDRAHAAWTRLGFTLTPRGFHSLGSQNHCVMLGRDYIELMGIPKPHPALQGFSDFLAAGEGAGAVALASDDAPAAAAAFREAGVAAADPVALSRPVEAGAEARFTLVQLPAGAAPGLHVFVCQHHTRDLVWRPQYQSHANAAIGIAKLTILADDEAPYRRTLPRVPIEVSATPPSRLGGVPMSRRKGPCVAAIEMQTSDRARTEAALRASGVAFTRLADGALAVGADAANGVALIFS